MKADPSRALPAAELLERLEALPRLGWVAEPTPLLALPELAEELGLAWLGVKRDDQAAELHGGTKLRKLDYCLATPRLADARRVVSVGAIGSGHLATLSAACAALDKELLACCFWEPLSPGVEENLATTVTGPARLAYHHLAAAMALAHPWAVLGAERSPGAAEVLAPGATDAPGVVGTIRAGLELARQLVVEALEPPDRLYLPLGSGGTAAGVALGLGLAGCATEVHAVATVPRAVARLGRLRGLMRLARTWLAARGVELIGEPAPLIIDHAHLGPGYGYATAESLAAAEPFAPRGLRVEPIYSGKAFAALRADAAEFRGRALFWLTPSRALPAPAPGWEERLPKALRRRLALARGGGLRRRQLLLRGAFVVGGLALGARVGLYPRLPAELTLSVLAPWEALVLSAAAEALVPERPGDPLPPGPSPRRLVENVDRFLVGMRPEALREVHALFALIEHGTGLDLHALRFTRLDAAGRLAFLERLARLGGPLAQASRGLRDLVYLGFYQATAAWPSIGYSGPLVPSPRGPRAGSGHARPPSRYDELMAPAGRSPAEAWS